MISSVAYYLIFGKPVIMYSGILSYLLIVFSAAISIMTKKGMTTIHFKWHSRVAYLAIISATIHALFGFSAYFGF